MIVDKEHPHIQITGLSGVEYNLPEFVFDGLSTGDMEIDELDNYEDVIPVIIAEWMTLR